MTSHNASTVGAPATGREQDSPSATHISELEQTDILREPVFRDILVMKMRTEFSEKLARSIEQGDEHGLLVDSGDDADALQTEFRERLQGMRRQLDRSIGAIEEFPTLSPEQQREALDDLRGDCHRIDQIELPIKQSVREMLELGLRAYEESIQDGVFVPALFEEACEAGVNSEFKAFVLERQREHEIAVETPADLTSIQVTVEASPEVVEAVEEMRGDPELSGLEPHEQSIALRLQQARRQLVSTGLGNNALNYKPGKSTGVTVVGEDPLQIYEVLVRDGKPFLFEPDQRLDEDGQTKNALAQPAASLADRADERLQTDVSSEDLQSRLFKSASKANTLLRDQGSNTLFLALGMLEWQDTERGQTLRAPLLTVPVTLERSGANSPYKLSHTGEDLEENLALRSRLLQEYGIELPEFQWSESFAPEEYLKAVQDAVEEKGFRIVPDAIHLDFFSYGKYQMYRDLDHKSWPEGKKPWENPVVESLLGGGFTPMAKRIPEGANLDLYLDPEELNPIVDADSSQLRAIVEMNEGGGGVIVGGPGTGKSQTIANFIAQAIFDGRRVLFVSEKLEALEVVQDEMVKAGLGNACLVLHDKSASRKNVVSQIKETFELGEPELEEIGNPFQTLRDCRQELNSHRELMARPLGRSGLSISDVMGALVEIGMEDPERKALKLDGAYEWSPEKLEEISLAVKQLADGLREDGSPHKNPFFGAQLGSLSPTLKPQLKDTLQDTQVFGAKAAERIREAFQAIDVEVQSLPSTTVRDFTDLLYTLAADPKLHQEMSTIRPQDRGWRLSSMISDILEKGKELSALQEKLDGKFQEQAFEGDASEIGELIERYTAARPGGGFLKEIFKWKDQYTTAKEVQALRHGVHPKLSREETKEALEDLQRARELRSEILAQEDVWKSMFGNVLWKGTNSDWEQLSKINDLFQPFVQKRYGSLPAAENVLKAIEDPTLLGAAGPAFGSAKGSLDEYQASLGRAFQQIDYSSEATRKFVSNPLATQQEQLALWEERIEDLSKLASYHTRERVCEELGIQDLTKTLELWPQAGEKLEESLRASYHQALIAQAWESIPELQSFDGLKMDGVLSRYVDADHERLQYNAARAAKAHWDRIPEMPTVNSKGQLGRLQRELGKRGNFSSTRELLTESGIPIQAAFPIILASPQAVAHLPSESFLRFDIGIADEASMMRPADMLGTAMRCNSVYTFGDRKQLPPTSFWERRHHESVSEEEVDHAITADDESILDYMAKARAPHTNLGFHYRSESEELIAFSNSRYYGGRLKTYPCPDPSADNLGIHYDYVDNGVYKGGKGRPRNNPIEASRVAEKVIEHALQNPDWTLGVVAFNASQVEEIENQIETLRRGYADDKEITRKLDDFFRQRQHEPFMVWNLESVQGQQRDVYIMSTTYGPKEDGKISMNFGPLNASGGERRLNTIVTRAKKQFHVVSSLRPEDIDTKRTASRGAHDLRDYLFFARDGVLNVNGAKLSQPQETPFQRGLQAAIEGHLNREGQRYEVVTNIGSTGYVVDLAIRRVGEQAPLMGIMLDGASYQGIENARDREIVGPQILERKGWNLHRMWMIEYFKQPEKILDEISAKLEKIEQGEVDAIIPERVPEASFTRKPSQGMRQATPTISAYTETRVEGSQFATRASFGSSPNAEQEYQAYLSEFRSLVSEIVHSEAALHIDELTKRLRDSGILKRRSDEYDSQLAEVLEPLVANGEIRREGEFLYSRQNTEIAIRGRANFSSNRKGIEYIPPEEIEAAIIESVRSSYGSRPSDIPQTAMLLFGIRSVSEEARTEVFPRQIEKLMEEGVLVEERGFLFVTDGRQ